MKRGTGMACTGILALSLAVLAMGGCGDRERTRVVALPPIELQALDNEGIRIDSIREYVGSGREEERLHLAWDRQAELLYQMKVEEDSCLYQAIDTWSNTMVSSVCVEDRAGDMSNISIAPGGRYVSYEIQNGGGMELRVFFPKSGIRQTLHTWEDPEETFSYIWCDDGTRLISWQNVDTRNPNAEWTVTEYNLASVSGEIQEGSFVGERTQFLMEGQGRSWRTVLPNADGSEIYVREQFRTFQDSMADEGEEREEGKDALNWLLSGEIDRMELAEYSQEPVYPVKYTPMGLYVQEADGSLCLVENIRSEHPVMKEVLSAAQEQLVPALCVCENGDHVFRMEWLHYSRYQVSGVRIQGGEVDGDPVVLYQGNYESLIRMAVQEDQAVVFWGKVPLDEEQYHYKVTVLEY